MTIHFVGAGPGAADLLTIRGRDLLARCPVCLYAGSIVPRAVLSYCPPDATLIDTAPMSLDEIEAEFVRADSAGLDAVRLHSGDLSIYSAVAEQVRRLQRHGIAYTLTPGVPAFAAAAAALGRELTVPAVSQSVVLTRLSGRASPMPPRERLEAFTSTGCTLAIHLAVHRLAQIVATLIPHYGSDCPVTVAARVSWPDEQILTGTLADIVARIDTRDVQRTALVLVGRALGCTEFRESALYEASYQRRFRSRRAERGDR